MAERRFEYKDGKSAKFWTIRLEGASHTVNYGRIGTDGQTKTKEFVNPEKAQASHDKLISQKVKKGYREVGVVAREVADPVSEVKALWSRIDDWFKVNRPRYHVALNPGASQKRIQQLESVLGLSVPAEVKVSLGIHDGQESAGPGVIGGLELLCCDRIEREWKMFQKMLKDEPELQWDDDPGDGAGQTAVVEPWLGPLVGQRRG